MTSQAQEIVWLLKEKYGGEKSDAFFADVKRLMLGEPLAYLIGHTPFLGCKIWLDSHPLIPRPETEFWAEKAIAVIQQQPTLGDISLGVEQASRKVSPKRLSGELDSCLDDTQDNVSSATREARQLSDSSQQVLAASIAAADASPNQTAALLSAPVRVLDLCAGSGCVGVAVAKAVPEALVDFAEIDKDHLPTISKNLRENDVDASRTNVLFSNLFGNIEHTYDFILSNPPYIDEALGRTDESVVTHEPHLALFGGRGGLEIIERLIAAAPAHLRSGGQLWIEHEPEQSADITVLAEANGFTITTHPDQYDVERYSILVLQ